MIIFTLAIDNNGPVLEASYWAEYENYPMRQLCHVADFL